MPYGKLDFVIAGVQKGGTTSLAEQISAHPNVSFCSEKEPHFFSKRQDVSSEKARLDYWSLYTGNDDDLYGEASTSYTFVDEYPETASKLYHHNPDMKIIIVLRDPIKRVISHVYHRMRKGLIPNGDVMASLHHHSDYIDRSRYYAQLKAYFDVFPESQIKVLRSESLHKNGDAFNDVLTFLGLSPGQMPTLDTSPKNISDASVRLRHIPMASLVIKWISQQPWAWRLTPYLPMKTTLPEEIHSYVAKGVIDDIVLLADKGWVEVSDWVDELKRLASR